MEWFYYVWMVPVALGLSAWTFFSIRDIFATIREYIKEPEDDILTYMADYLEDYTKSFIGIILFALFFGSFAGFIVNCVSIE
jgi:hypothetical protein